MKRKPLILLMFLTCLLVFNGCDFVEEPVDPGRQVVTTGKKVLLEDFTGQECGSCPRAHVLTEDLQEVYGENLIVVAVHFGSFAIPDPQAGYPSDYRTPMGNTIGDSFEIDGLPAGLVSRRTFNGEAVTQTGKWSTHVAELLAEAPQLGIDLEASYDATSMTATITTEMEYFQPGNADHHIVAIITEDSIISKQSDYSMQPDYVDNYVHMHMLRKSITEGNFGEPVKGAEIFVGEKITRTFTTELDPSWKPENCNVVVYVIDNASREVLQVEQVHL